MTPQQLKAWRKRMGWTQRQAAERLGVRRQWITELESGRHPIQEMFALACEALEKRA